MSGPKPESFDASPVEEPQREQVFHDRSTPFEVATWANLVAVGSIAWPSGLSVEEQQSLIREVSRLRRKRLMKFIAQAIARDIFREQKPSK